VSGEELNEEELAVSLNSQLTRYWSLGLDTRHDLADGGGTLRSGVSLRYDDECLTLDLRAARDYTYDRDYEDGYRFGLRVVFKTLGEVQTSASQ
jgi:LPS-assembly protein